MATSPPCNHKTSAIEEGKVAMDIDEAITTTTEPAEEVSLLLVQWLW